MDLNFRLLGELDCMNISSALMSDPVVASTNNNSESRDNQLPASPHDSRAHHELPLSVTEASRGISVHLSVHAHCPVINLDQPSRSTQAT